MCSRPLEMIDLDTVILYVDDVKAILASVEQRSCFHSTQVSLNITVSKNLRGILSEG